MCPRHLRPSAETHTHVLGAPIRATPTQIRWRLVLDFFVFFHQPHARSTKGIKVGPCFRRIAVEYIGAICTERHAGLKFCSNTNQSEMLFQQEQSNRRWPCSCSLLVSTPLWRLSQTLSREAILARISFNSFRSFVDIPARILIELADWICCANCLFNSL
jgi:hypothetical protein